MLSLRRRLRQSLRRHARKKFTYGDIDCCLFAAKVVRDVHGVDYAPRYPEYSNLLGATRIIREFGSIHDLVSSTLGDPVPAEEASDGDVVLGDFPEIGEAVGIACGGVAWFKVTGNVAPIPLKYCRYSWNPCPTVD